LLPLEVLDPAEQLPQVEGPLAADLDGAGDLAGFRHLLRNTFGLADQRQRFGHLDSLVEL